MPKKIIPFINLTLAMVIVGSSVVAGKLMVAELPVFLASALRFMLAVLILLPILYLREGGLPKLSRRSWLLLGGQSLCGSFLFTVFLLYGLRYTGPSSAGIITATTPACMGIMAWIFLRDRPGTRTGLGILLSVLGVAAINMAGATGGIAGPNPILGNGLVLGAVLFESLFLLVRKTVHEPLSPMAASTIISLYGLIWFLPVGTAEFFACDLTGVSATGWLSVVYYGAVVTVLAYLFWFAGITKVRASTAGVFTAVMPVSALALSALVLNEPLSLGQLAGCAFVLVSIFLITRK